VTGTTNDPGMAESATEAPGTWAFVSTTHVLPGASPYPGPSGAHHANRLRSLPSRHHATQHHPEPGLNDPKFLAVRHGDRNISDRNCSTCRQHHK
jgi:hypothetical protein